MEDADRMRIIQEAAALFNAKGYRSVTLSELAARLGMSKKTLYVYFSGKEEIAEVVVRLTLDRIAGTVTAHLKREGDPIQLLQETFESIRNEIVKLNPLFLEDIQKYVPALWKQMEAFRSRQLTFVEELLVRAKEAGQIRDIQPRLVSAMILESIQRMGRPDFAAKHGVTVPDVMNALFALFITGLRSDRTS
ncbi:TetR/AcrR family transcriptional regulator [Paenibacillus sp. P26]|nr:TetR/AcrR family transcriptional regulator [Paenibacillus sp. P26]UUZ95436.1 TetR/AcrR family transcriptional regulator [Paenibacillus sp. P25]